MGHQALHAFQVDAIPLQHQALRRAIGIAIGMSGVAVIPIGPDQTQPIPRDRWPVGVDRVVHQKKIVPFFQVGKKLPRVKPGAPL